MHLILNEFRLRFNQLSSIVLFRALSLFTSRFDPILYLAQLLTRNLVDLPLKLCCRLRSIQSGDAFSELYSLNNCIANLYINILIGVALLFIWCSFSNDTFSSVQVEQSFNALADAESNFFFSSCFKVVRCQISLLL